jgi:hypothetical protein
MEEESWERRGRGGKEGDVEQKRGMKQGGWRQRKDSGGDMRGRRNL